jgi:hypothetical protein
MALHLLQMEQDGGKHQNKWSKIYSQRSVEEHLMETTIGDGDTHLVEFSDAMRSMKQVSLTLCSLSVLVSPQYLCTENLIACNYLEQFTNDFFYLQLWKRLFGRWLRVKLELMMKLLNGSGSTRWNGCELLLWSRSSKRWSRS